MAARYKMINSVDCYIKLQTMPKIMCSLGHTPKYWRRDSLQTAGDFFPSHSLYMFVGIAVQSY